MIGLERSGSKNVSSLLIRIGLATVFLYASVSGTVHPQDWVGYLPSILTSHINAELLLKFFSAYELALAALLLSDFYTRYVGLLCALTFAGIIVSNLSLLPISFRDIGLLFAALALVFDNRT